MKFAKQSGSTKRAHRQMNVRPTNCGQMPRKYSATSISVGPASLDMLGIIKLFRSRRLEGWIKQGECRCKALDILTTLDGAIDHLY